VDLKEVLALALEVEEKYAQTNDQPWSVSEYVQGFMGDLGTLAKLVMAKEGFRTISDVDSKLKHELADCLWSIVVISDKLGIDLAEVFPVEMKALLARFA